MGEVRQISYLRRKNALLTLFRLFQAAPKRKRGQRTTDGRAAHSTKRVARMFHEADSKPVGYQMVNSTSVKRVLKPVTEYQQQQIDDWVCSTRSLALCVELTSFL